MNQPDAPLHSSVTPASDGRAPDGSPTQSSAHLQRRALLAAVGGLAAGLALNRSAAAGPLNPPAGPVTSTGKTLVEVEPRIAINATNTPGDATNMFLITQPGSYYLTGNIAGALGRRAIGITSSGVTIDLCGFDVRGMTGTLDGIAVVAPGVRNIAISNGSIIGWSGHGVDLGNSGSIRLADLVLFGNSFGIRVGSGATVTRCTALSNSGSGITAFDTATISACTAAQNAGNGITVRNHCTVTACTVHENAGTGIDANIGCVISDCAIASNSVHGIAALESCNVFGNATRNNTGNGIRVHFGCRVVGNVCEFDGYGTSIGAGIFCSGSDSRVEANVCNGADRGIHVLGSGNFITRNTCSGNAVNWEIAANNVVGPILDRTAPGSAAILGSSAPGSLGTTDANANFTI